MSKVLSFVRKMVPFESIWLVFIKVMILNKFSCVSLLKLIARDDYSSRAFLPAWWSSDFVSTGKLESLLQLSAGQLDSAYIENTVPAAFTYLNLRVRHCKKCIERNYHSSLFSLPYLLTCPWHGEVLVECAGCGISIQLSGMHPVAVDDIRNHLLCEHVQSLILQPFHKFNNCELENLSQWYTEFRAWLTQAENIVGEDVFVALTESANYRWKVDFLFNYLEPIIGLSFPRVNGEFFPVVRISMFREAKAWLQIRTLTRKAARSKFLQSECNATSIICYEDMIASMKSLRRFIVKRFLRKHKSCLRRLNLLTQEQRLHMDFDSRCSCSIAYSCWLLQLLDVNRLVSFSAKKKRRYRCPACRKSYPKTLFKIDLINYMAKFHSIWASIEFARKQMDLYKLDVRFVGESSHGIYNYSYFCACKPRSSEDDGCGMSHYIVEPDFVSAHNLARCQKYSRENLSISLCDEVIVEDIFTTNTALVYRLVRSLSTSRNTFYVTVGMPKYPTT